MPDATGFITILEFNRLKKKKEAKRLSNKSQADAALSN